MLYVCVYARVARFDCLERGIWSNIAKLTLLGLCSRDFPLSLSVNTYRGANELAIVPTILKRTWRQGEMRVGEQDVEKNRNGIKSVPTRAYALVFYSSLFSLLMRLLSAYKVFSCLCECVKRESTCICVCEWMSVSFRKVWHACVCRKFYGFLGFVSNHFSGCCNNNISALLAFHTQTFICIDVLLLLSWFYCFLFFLFLFSYY